jgi:hypothetical protein
MGEEHFGSSLGKALLHPTAEGCPVLAKLRLEAQDAGTVLGFRAPQRIVVRDPDPHPPACGHVPPDGATGPELRVVAVGGEKQDCGGIGRFRALCAEPRLN